MALTDESSSQPTSQPQNSWRLSGFRVVGLIILTLLLAITGQVVFASIWSVVTGQALGDASVKGEAIFQLGLWVGALVVPIYVVASRRLNFRHEMGLRIKWTDIPLGLTIGVLLQVVVLRIVNLPLELFFPKEFEDLSKPAQELLSNLSTTDFVIRALMATIAAPIVEEIVFRGFVFGALVRRFTPWIAIVGSSLLFGAIHGNPVSIVSLAIVGASCAYAYYRTQRLGLAITIHMGFNAVAVVVLFFTR